MSLGSYNIVPCSKENTICVYILPWILYGCTSFCSNLKYVVYERHFDFVSHLPLSTCLIHLPAVIHIKTSNILDSVTMKSYSQLSIQTFKLKTVLPEFKNFGCLWSLSITLLKFCSNINKSTFVFSSNCKSPVPTLARSDNFSVRVILLANY